MVERGISASEVREAVTKGTKRRQENRIVSSYRNLPGRKGHGGTRDSCAKSGRLGPGQEA
ncbi:MAG: hypothetical protein HYT80_02410 [Euryarchaeota archaeon]|nr:hypothetical protein [Euryarchaeota archaeon]